MNSGTKYDAMDLQCAEARATDSNITESISLDNAGGRATTAATVQDKCHPDETAPRKDEVTTPVRPKKKDRSWLYEDTSEIQPNPPKPATSASVNANKVNSIRFLRCTYHGKNSVKKLSKPFHSAAESHHSTAYIARNVENRVQGDDGQPNTAGDPPCHEG